MNTAPTDHDDRSNETLSARLFSILEDARQQHLFPGASLAWISDPHEPAQTLAVGSLAYDTDFFPSNDLISEGPTLYDCASITKSIPTSCIAIRLAQKQFFTLDTLVTTVLPEYQGENKKTLTLEDLIAFRAPFELQMSSLKDLSAEEIWDRVLLAPIASQSRVQPFAKPSAKPAYINATSILLTKVLERATTSTLPKLAQELFFQPLDMHHTTFTPQTLQAKNLTIAPTEIDPWRNRVIHGEVHDESAWKLQELFTPGSAGLFSTATDLIQFARMLLLASSGEKESIFSAANVQKMSAGLGWETHSDWLKGTPPETFGKTGFTGCHIAISPQTQKAVVLLSNSTWPHRTHRDTALLRQLRQSINVSIL